MFQYKRYMNKNAPDKVLFAYEDKSDILQIWIQWNEFGGK